MYNTAFVKHTNLKPDFRTVFKIISWENEKKTTFLIEADIFLPQFYHVVSLMP